MGYFMSSKRRLRRKMCDGKQRFASEKEARTAIWKLKQTKPGSGFVAPYRCSFCKQFHFGHPPARIRQAMAAMRN